jgi:hypothetical protein
MLQNVKKHLPTRSRPHMALNGHGAMSELGPLCDQKRTSLRSYVNGRVPASAFPNGGLYYRDLKLDLCFRERVRQ